MNRSLQEIRRRILAKTLSAERRGYIVKWRHWPVLFCGSNDCRHVYSLVDAEEATQFESPIAAVKSCQEYGLKLQDCEILTT